MNYLILGGTGQIGGAIANLLIQLGHEVVATGRRDINVTDEKSIDAFLRGCDVRRFDGIVYAVGSCPPGGFVREIAQPLSSLRAEKMVKDFDLHVVGLQQIFRTFPFKTGSAVLVISSGITRIPDAVCPDKLFAGHYATAKAAQNELVKWLRRDPFAKGHRLLIHRLGVGAVDTPFHDGAPPELTPPVLYSLDFVARRAVKALMSNKVVDYDFNPMGKMFSNWLKKLLG